MEDCFCKVQKHYICWFWIYWSNIRPVMFTAFSHSTWPFHFITDTQNTRGSPCSIEATRQTRDKEFQCLGLDIFTTGGQLVIDEEDASRRSSKVDRIRKMGQGRWSVSCSTHTALPPAFLTPCSAPYGAKVTLVESRFILHLMLAIVKSTFSRPAQCHYTLTKELLVSISIISWPCAFMESLQPSNCTWYTQPPFENLTSTISYRRPPSRSSSRINCLLTSVVGSRSNDVQSSTVTRYSGGVGIA